jgi:hypothetical protein
MSNISREPVRKPVLEGESLRICFGSSIVPS